MEQVFFLKDGRIKVAQGETSKRIGLLINLIKEHKDILMESANSAGFEETGRYLKMPVTTLRNFFKTEESE
jgi:hypothetical protein